MQPILDFHKQLRMYILRSVVNFFRLNVVVQLFIVLILTKNIFFDVRKLIFLMK